MTLRQRQSLFASLVPRLIDKAIELGYEVTLGEAYRSPEEALRLSKAGAGIKNSLHTSRLAIDLNLLKDGRYIVNREGHDRLGEWWKTLHPWCAAGIDFGDPNHYSLKSRDGRS